MFEENPAEAWRIRFGSEPKAVLPDLGRFLNHRSVREYESRPVDEDTVRCLVGAAQSAATSSNLHLWSVVTVHDPERRKQMSRLCGDQKHVLEAPWFFAFLADHNRLSLAAKSVGEQALGLDYNEFYTMAVIDASLAAERLVCTAESMGLGICYIGGLRNDPSGVKNLLQLPSGTFGLFGLCLGWPAAGSSATIKPRLNQDAVWFRESYGDPDIREYDARMREFYESQKMKGEVTWSMRSGKRVDEHHLSGREAIKGFLEEQGLDKR